MIRYPVEKYGKLIDNSKAFYPITSRGFWHNGAHFTSNSAAVRNIHTGTVVAMRLTEDYEKIDVGKIPERYQDRFASYISYFTFEGGFYTIKENLTEEDLDRGLTEKGKLNALIMIGSIFSNNFVLVKHTAETQDKKSIEFYSLAMHLRPLNKLSFAEKVTTCWYYIKVSINPNPTHNSVKANSVNIRTEFNKDNDGNGITVNTYTMASRIHQIPCETVIKVLEDDSDQTYSIIEWTLNGSRYTGAIDKSLYRDFTDHSEIKRPGNNSNKHLIKDDHIYDDATAGLLVYSEKSKDTRTVVYLLKPNVTLLIDSQFYVDYDDDIGTLVSFIKNGTLCHGYIYLEISDIDTLTKDIKDATELSVTSVTSGNYTFELEIKKNIDINAVSVPNAGVATGDIIGYLGSGGHTGDAVLPLHYEIFCSDNGFMTFNEDKELYRSYFYTIPEGSAISGYREKPRADREEKEISLLENKELKNVYLELTGQNKTLVQEEVFYKVSVIAKIEEQNSHVKIERKKLYMESSYYMYESEGNEFFCDETGQPTTEIIPKGCSYLLKEIEKTKEEETEVVYKIVYLYTPLSSDEKKDNIFWLNGKDLEKLVKYAYGEDKYTEAQRFSTNDYLLTGSLLAEKILEEPVSIKWGTAVTLKDVTLDDENASINIWNGKTLKKMRSGTTSYWIDSSELHEKTEVNYNKWNDFFYEVATENAVTGYKPENYKNLLFSRNKPFDDATNFSNVIACYKEELSQLVHKRSTEWKESEEYIDAFCKGLGSNKREFIETKLEKLSFWDEVSSKQTQPVEQSLWDRLRRKPKPEPPSTSPNFPAKEINWYFHPINFINHLNKVVPINPYIGAKKIAYPGEKGRPALFEVTDSPGFAPVSTSGDEYTVDGKTYYAHLTGYFNEDYINEGNYKESFKEFYHEGVDFSGAVGTDIHSLIYAKVIAYGWFGNYGKTIILRNLSETGVYLLAHLSEYMENIDEIMEKPAEEIDGVEVKPAQVGVEVIPGQVVGKTGRSGTYLNRWDPHLHITYYHYTENERSKNIFETRDFIGTSIKEISSKGWTEYEKLKATIRDPFNHTTEKLANNKNKEK